jgi:hypothetical protein
VGEAAPKNPRGRPALPIRPAAACAAGGSTSAVSATTAASVGPRDEPRSLRGRKTRAAVHRTADPEKKDAPLSVGLRCGSHTPTVSCQPGLARLADTSQSTICVWAVVLWTRLEALYFGGIRPSLAARLPMISSTPCLVCFFAPPDTFCMMSKNEAAKGPGERSAPCPRTKRDSRHFGSRHHHIPSDCGLRPNHRESAGLDVSTPLRTTLHRILPSRGNVGRRQGRVQERRPSPSLVLSLDFIFPKRPTCQRDHKFRP